MEAIYKNPRRNSTRFIFERRKKHSIDDCPEYILKFAESVFFTPAVEKQIIQLAKIHSREIQRNFGIINFDKLNRLSMLKILWFLHWTLQIEQAENILRKIDPTPENEIL